MKRNNCKMWLLVLSAVLCVNTESAAADCKYVPACSNLGFKKTASECSGAKVVLKCPFDTSKYACYSPSTIYEPKAGYYLYSDRSVSPREKYDEYVAAGKTPIGIVFDADNRLARALFFADKYGNPTDGGEYGNACSGAMQWGYYSGRSLSEITCKDDSALTSCATDGRKNTYALLANSLTQNTMQNIVTMQDTVATAVHNYKPSGCSADFCKAGKWFLPSAKEISTMREKNLLLTAQGGGVNYWTSTAKDDDAQWTLNMIGSPYFGSHPKSNTSTSNCLYALPVLAF